MKTIAKLISIFLLLLNGFGAIYGGFLLISDPSGSKLQLPMAFLEHSPFNNYLIPGIILITVNGLFSFITLGAILLKKDKYYWLIIAQSILLGGWIIIQMLMLRIFYPPLHLTFLIIGTCLLLCGLYLKQKQPMA